jgi:hypothetical protein
MCSSHAPHLQPSPGQGVEGEHGGVDGDGGPTPGEASRPAGPASTAAAPALAAHGVSGAGGGASFSTGEPLQVRSCRVVRARARHACDACVSPEADAPSCARSLCRADRRSVGEGRAV